MKRLLIMNDDGIYEQLKWVKDYLREKYEIVELDFDYNASGIGTLRNYQSVFPVKNIYKNKYITSMPPVMAAEWAMENLRFDQVLIGVNNGLNFVGKDLYSSSSMVMASIFAERANVIVASTKHREVDLTGEESKLVSVTILKVFEGLVKFEGIVSINFVADLLTEISHFKFGGDGKTKDELRFKFVRDYFWEYTVEPMEESLVQENYIGFDILKPWLLKQNKE